MKRLLILFSCIGLTCATFANGVEIDGICYLLDGDTAIVTYKGETYYSNTYSGAISIPTSVTYQSKTYPVTTIGDDAFWECSGLTYVTIPNSVTTIGGSAFQYCSGLTSVTIGNSVTTIGRWAFASCSGLTSITIPNSVTTIGAYAFRNCSGLSSVTIPNSVTLIDDCAFSDCTKIISVTWNAKNCKNRNNGADFGSQVESFTFGNEVETIPTGLCKGMNKLTTITIPNSVTTIESFAFAYCRGLTSVIIPNSVTKIDWSAFSGCTKIISVTWNAKNCKNQVDFGSQVESFTFGNEVETIPAGLCKGMNKLTTITIPNSVTKIGVYTFYDCTGLSSVSCCAKNPPICTEACFYGVGNEIPIYVPFPSLEAYKHADGWKYFSNFYSDEQYKCGEDLFWKYEDEILKIEGRGEMYDYTSATIPWKVYQDSITKVTFPAGVTSIGNCAFCKCGKLTMVSIPNSVTAIGDSAFANCTYLTDVTIGANVKEIGCSAFAGDYRIENITCYAPITPNVCSTTFSGINKSVVYLYVPADYQRKYQVDPNWAGFNLHLIGAEEKPITGDEVTVDPSADNVTFTWPQNDQAAEYNLVITKDGIVFCTLTFNAQGQLIGIAFAPNRAGSRMLDAAVMTANGWQFTVTGLDQASKYGYALDALNASKQSIKHYEGEFATDGYTSLEWVTSDKIQGINKMLLDGHLYILRDGNLYNATGARVK